MRYWVSGLLMLGLGCREAKTEGPPSEAPVAASAPADSLVLVTAGYEIWFAEGRVAQDSSGVSCFERSVEIRRGDKVTKVPLLFTNRPPRPLGDGFIGAELMRDCRVIARYRVELTTGRPTKVADQ